MVMNIAFIFSQATFSSNHGVVVMIVDFKTKGCEFKARPLLIFNFVLFLFHFHIIFLLLYKIAQKDF